MTVNQRTANVYLANENKRSATVIIGEKKATVKFISDAHGDNLGNHLATQNLHMNDYRITNLGTPISGYDATTKAYVDEQIFLSGTGSIDAGTGMTKAGNVLNVNGVSGIQANPNNLQVDFDYDFVWNGMHDFNSGISKDGTELYTSFSELNQISGINTNVTDTNLNILTSGGDATSLHTHTTKFVSGISGASSYSIAHNLGDLFVNAKFFETTTNIEVEPQTVTATDGNTLSATFGAEFSGNVMILKGDE